MLQRKLKSIKLLTSPPAAIASDDSLMNISKKSRSEEEGEEDEEVRVEEDLQTELEEYIQYI